MQAEILQPVHQLRAVFPGNAGLQCNDHDVVLLKNIEIQMVVKGMKKRPTGVTCAA